MEREKGKEIALNGEEEEEEEEVAFGRFKLAFLSCASCEAMQSCQIRNRIGQLQLAYSARGQR